jgi:hypothetical protein
MLMIDRKSGQSLLLVHEGKQCLIHVLRTAQNSVRFGFEGDSFRFLRSERSVVRRMLPGLRLRRQDHTIVHWG